MSQGRLRRLLAHAPPALLDMLDGGRGPVLSPVRSEIFGAQRFAQHGRSLAATHRATRASPFAATFFPRLRQNIFTLREAHRYIGLQASTGYDISPAAEWLLDNFHLIEAQLKEIHDGLPRSYFHALPLLQDEPLAGLPRVYGVAWAFVAHTDGAFDENLLLEFLNAYQQARELNLSEMWALPTTLRVVLIENLRRLAERIATNKAARQLANLCCDQTDSYSVQALDQLLDPLRQRGVSRVFLAQMAQRLQDRRTTGDDGYPAHYHDWLHQELPDLATAQTQQNADQAADNLSVSNAVTSLRAIGDADWPDLVARSSPLMRLMLSSQVFEAEDGVTRDETLHGIEALAKRSNQSEVAVAQVLLKLMHAGKANEHTMALADHWLCGKGRATLTARLGLHERQITGDWATPVYLGSVLLVSIGLVAWMMLANGVGLGTGGAPGWLALVLAALLIFPASEAVVAVINRLISESARPRHLPRFALVTGIPLEHRVLVVIPAMLSSAASTSEMVRRLELHHLANPERHAQFALLSDWVDADAPTLATDDALLLGARQQIHELNLRYPNEADQAGAPPRFILLHRERLFSATEQRWIGWERKRGKLERLVAVLATGASGVFLELGAESRLAANTRYLVTLDSDTQLPPGRLRELVSVAAHPRNQPQLDASARRVVAGYAILQPRVATPLPASRDFTLYHWLFAGQCGIDPYSAASSEVYQDLFGEGTFTGKGLLNIQAIHAVLSGRLPEDQVLSHDLLEGSLARCATVTDIAVIEEAPFHADVAASRVHRWTRGDWQLLPFLLNPKRYPMRTINRWKVFDNLRRSLVAPMSLALLLLSLGTAVLPPGVTLVLLLAAFSAGPLMGAVAGLLPSRVSVAKLHFYREAAIELARALCGGLWHLALLLQQALLSIDAVGRALYRMVISRRHLLQWTTAQAAQASAKTSLKALLRVHWSLPLVALALLVGLLALATPFPLLTIVLCLLWAVSPVLIWFVSRTHPGGQQVPLSPPDQAYLAGIARDTWRFFEHCVSAADNHLPPDNLQTTPHGMLAHRTSPTNIGLYLLSVACARQFGWIGTHEFLDRMESTLATLLTLQRHCGHFLNWYDTQTRAALLPMYVSTVDSGNFSGHLLAVAQACLVLAHAPQDGGATQRAIAAARLRLAPLLAQRSKLAPTMREELKWCLSDLRATLRSAKADEPLRQPGAQPAAPRLQALARAFEQLALQADFGFLYDRKRHLFHIGYRVAEQQLDASFYDLLVSESRLTSLLAIAKGDAPVRHWASLGRLFFAVGANAGLRSWSGSMFEYLMPSLVLDEPQGSVLREAVEAALVEQIAYAKAQGVPWGISESAYAGSDDTLAYQYAPQGVPRLALRRTPTDELVIAPYATALAAQIAAQPACRNFASLQTLGARSRYGFIEALDFSPARQAGSALVTPVHTFMAHHQGMSIVALANVLLGGVAQGWGMANAQIEAVSSLLHERVPREISLLYAPTAGTAVQAPERRHPPRMLREVLPGGTALEPTHLLSNGRYSVTVRANGAGWSRWGQTGITRWRDDALRDAFGSFFYVRRLPRAPLVSMTQHPAPDSAAHYRSLFHADRVCFEAIWPELQSNITVWVSPEDDIEFRQVELRNLSSRTMDIELLSAFEVTLTPARADEAHPAFTNLFVRAQWQAEHQALIFERTPRLATEQGLLAGHFLADSDPQLVSLSCQTDRQRWLGRNQGASRPLALLEPLLPTKDGADGAQSPQPEPDLVTGLDPVCVLAARLRIAPNTHVRLTFATAASDNRDTLHAVIDKYRQPSHVQRASLMSATLTGIRLRALRMSADNFATIQTLTTALVLGLTRPQARAMSASGAPTPVCDQRLLWRFGISGDRPLILVSVGVPQGLGLLRSLVQALSLWAWGGIGCDLVVVNTEPASYLMALQREIAALRERYVSRSGEKSPPVDPNATAFHLLRAQELSSDELSTLQAKACVRLHADGRPLLHHVQEWSAQHELALDQRHETSTHAPALASGEQVQESVPVGKFDSASGEFGFEISTELRAPRPWINVLANPAFGTLLSEAGGGYSWALNSRLMQLTAWSNDPVADPASEWFLLQDSKTREVWNVAPGTLGDEMVAYRVSHGQGYSTISHQRGDLTINALWCVDAMSSVKQVRLRIMNGGHRTRHLRVVGIAEWMMGANRSDRSTVHTALFKQRLAGQQLTALLCTQRERSAGFGDGTAFFGLANSEAEEEDWTCDRRELFDARGRLVLPDYFGKSQGSGLDPCAALSTRVTLNGGDTLERVFLLGYAESPDAARQLVTLCAATPAEQRLAQVRSHWDQLLGATTVQTPDPLFDALVNRWLLYQTVVSRLWAKAGFYQAGGATGFRDQLQDAMALVWAAPEMLRAQIVLAASRQFPEGDVQHWWHAPTGAGVRTHFSDDRLWLAYATQHYLCATGDTALLDERVPFIEGAAIPVGAEDAYDTPRVSALEATVYEHAARTIDGSLAVGVHGLPLMGSGDWNDGMNRVGYAGRGESVWLGWFLCQLVADFAPLARLRGDASRALHWENAALGWKTALSDAAWDGQWFRRAFFDDGQVLGSHANPEASIDLIAQAWSVLSEVAPKHLQRLALTAVEEHLVDHAAGLIKLLDPPLVHAVPSAGYIQAYPPGVRENGGQYSHAGVWALMAQAELASSEPGASAAGDLAYRYFTYLSPAHRAIHPQRGPVYGLEPYVVAGDVYSQPPYVGRGGWSWYTGAAGWMHRAAIESIFGLRLGAQQLSFTPCLPSDWPRAELTLTRGTHSMRFILLRSSESGALTATAQWGAQLLRPGEALHWPGLTPMSCFVIALPCAGSMGTSG